MVELRHGLVGDDADAVAALVAAATAANGRPALSEQKRIALAHPERGGFTAFVARREPTGPIVGFGQLASAGAVREVELVLDPAAPDHETLREELLAAAQRAVADGGGGRLYYWVSRPDERDERVATAAGMATGRDLLQLVRPLPTEAALRSDGNTPTRAFRIGADEAGWLLVNARAFADHPEQGAWDNETLKDREAEDWFDAEGFLVHDGHGGIDAFCWTKVHHDEQPAVGEIYVIGVDPDAQGSGLGKAMLSAGLDHLADMGIGKAMLYVDADVRPARRLYDAFGFTLDHVDRAYVIDVDPR